MSRIYRNIKTQKLYKVIDTLVTNATNKQDGQTMVLYKDLRGHKYVRQSDEFFEKFQETTLINLYE